MSPLNWAPSAPLIRFSCFWYSRWYSWAVMLSPPTSATLTSMTLLRMTSPMPQIMKDATSTMNRILKNQDEALERMNCSM